MFSPRIDKIRLILPTLFLVAAGCLYLLHARQSQIISIETFSLPAAQHGLQAHIDPDTGQFRRPTATQARQAQPKNNLQKSSQVRKIRMQDGTVILDLTQHYRPNGGR